MLLKTFYYDFAMRFFARFVSVFFFVFFIFFGVFFVLFPVCDFVLTIEIDFAVPDVGPLLIFANILAAK